MICSLDQRLSLTVTPSEISGEVLGLGIAFGGTELLTFIRNGKLAEAALVCTLSYIYGKVLYICFKTTFTKCGLCRQNSQAALPESILHSVEKVMKYVLIGFLPSWGSVYPSLTFGSAALYLTGSISPYAAIRGVISIIKEVQKRCIEEDPTNPKDVGGNPANAPYYEPEFPSEDPALPRVIIMSQSRTELPDNEMTTPPEL